MENYTVAVGYANCGASPIMPYIGGRIDGVEIANKVRLNVQAALLRCGLDVINLESPIGDRQDVVTPVFRHKADAAIVISLAAFGSRKSFNDIGGCVVHCANGRFYGQSRTLCEDICAKLCLLRGCKSENDGVFDGANCKTSTVDVGYLTCFDDVRTVCDPDYMTAVAEHIAMGICENFSMPYTVREDFSAYLITRGSAVGKRGKKIKLLQTLLSAHGYKLVTDGVFGKNTELAIKTFCINNDTDCNGLSERLFTRLLGIDRTAITVGNKSTTAEYINAKLRAKLYDAEQSIEFTENSLAALNEFLSENNRPAYTHTDNISLADFPELTAIGGGRPRLF